MTFGGVLSTPFSAMCTWPTHADCTAWVLNDHEPGPSGSDLGSSRSCRLTSPGAGQRECSGARVHCISCSWLDRQCTDSVTSIGLDWLFHDRAALESSLSSLLEKRGSLRFPGQGPGRPSHHFAQAKTLLYSPGKSRPQAGRSPRTSKSPGRISLTCADLLFWPSTPRMIED